MGNDAGNISTFLGRVKLEPGGGDDGIGATGMGAIVGHFALPWDKLLMGAGGGAEETP